MKLLLLFLLWVPAAWGQAPPQKKTEAERFFRAGAKAYESGQYEAACRALEHAYELDPLPAIAFSLAQAYRLRYFADANPDHLRRAKTLYQEYLAATPRGGRRHDAATALAEIDPVLSRLDPSTATVELLEQPTQLLITCPIDGARVSIDGGEPLGLPATVDVAPGAHALSVSAEGYFDAVKNAVAVDGRLVVEEIELSAKPALITLTGDAGRIFVDGKPAGAIPLSAPLEVPAGSHALSVVANGRLRWDRSFAAEKGDALGFDVELHTTGQRYLAWTVIAGAGAAAIAGGAFSVGAWRQNQEARELDRLRTTGGIDEAQLDDYEGYLRDRKAFRNTAIGLFSSAAILGLTGALLYLFDEPDLAF
jgi:hypothetical protein